MKPQFSTYERRYEALCRTARQRFGHRGEVAFSDTMLMALAIVEDDTDFVIDLYVRSGSYVCFEAVYEAACAAALCLMLEDADTTPQHRAALRTRALESPEWNTDDPALVFALMDMFTSPVFGARTNDRPASVVSSVRELVAALGLDVNVNVSNRPRPDAPFDLMYPLDRMWYIESMHLNVSFFENVYTHLGRALAPDARRFTRGDCDLLLWCWRGLEHRLLDDLSSSSSSAAACTHHDLCSLVAWFRTHDVLTDADWMLARGTMIAQFTRAVADDDMGEGGFHCGSTEEYVFARATAFCMLNAIWNDDDSTLATGAPDLLAACAGAGASSCSRAFRALGVLQEEAPRP